MSHSTSFDKNGFCVFPRSSQEIQTANSDQRLEVHETALDAEGS
eukprot:CAMPEP_0176469778 /NCGR_PEP_ID=MMETSP0127-20121128/40053_1 /TAXON_ID=938130 /ORGANISM="Platyophrya macrostoma, Strain WH" /LENGTH=43 /DNA_ID= /DNA_START= /DNA_END= /DNA_ORIENTATION=